MIHFQNAQKMTFVKPNSKSLINVPSMILNRQVNIFSMDIASEDG